MTISLIIATYNAPDKLRLCLKSVLRQTTAPSEVIIADDGSTAETSHTLELLRPLFQMPLRHIWHEDCGFRLAAIRNKAIDAATSDYIIQIDGDVIIERHFIEDHIRFSRPECFVLGSRSMITQERTSELLQLDDYEPSVWMSGLKRRDSALRCPWVTPLFFNSRHTVGCNMAFWRSDLLEVNGYDEDFQGYGHEDRDLCLRLVMAGKVRRKLKYAAIQYHLWHKEQPRDDMEHNARQVVDRKLSGKYWAANGIAKQS